MNIESATTPSCFQCFEGIGDNIGQSDSQFVEDLGRVRIRREIQRLVDNMLVSFKLDVLTILKGSSINLLIPRHRFSFPNTSEP